MAYDICDDRADVDFAQLIIGDGMSDNKRIIIIDGNSLVNRAYYAIRNPMMTKHGVYTHAVYGFINILNKIINEYDPAYMLIAFDMKAPTFRHKQYEEYKAGRKKMPPELAMQIPILKEVLDAMNISRMEFEGYEADDLIGTVAKRAESENLEPLIITGDKDELQLVSDVTKVMLTRKGISDFEMFDAQTMLEKYGFTPKQFIDYKGLVGDSSDNIPGIPGVGDKSGTNLIKEFGSVEEVIARSAEIKSPALRGKVEEYAQQALMSKMLATINTSVPVEYDIASFKRIEPDYSKLVEIYTRLEFRSLLSKLDIRTEAAESHIPTDNDLNGELERINDYEIGTLEEIEALEEKMKEYVRVKGDDALAIIKIFSDCNHRNLPSVEAVALLFDDNYYYINIAPASVNAENTDAKIAAVCRVLLSGAGLAGHALGRDYYVLLAHGAKNLKRNKRVFHTVFDTEVAQYVSDPGRNNYNLKTLMYEYFGAELAEEHTILGGGEQLNILEDNSSAYRDYGKRYCVAVKLLSQRLRRDLADSGLISVCDDIEFPLIEVLASMENIGFSASTEKLKQIGAELEDRITGLKEEIYKEAGEEFNINSTKQLSVILFENMGLPPSKKTKTGYSTDIEVLEGLRGEHRIVELILDYRSLSKLNSTYVAGLIPTIARDGRIHAHFKQSVTATGRISCIDPNLQNIPVKQAEGRRIRGAFFAARGKKLVSADYSQIELRVLAHMSGDERLIEAFNCGEDIHASTAAAVFGVDKTGVSREQRSAAKAVNFGVIYGMSSFGLSKELGISVKKAENYINSYFDNHEGVRSYLDASIDFARENGYVETLSGRRRYIPELGARQVNVRNYGERLAMNTPIQGTAADIIKLAMNAVYDGLLAADIDAELLLQIHDELIIEAAESDVEAVVEILEKVMAGVMDLSVDLVTDLNISDNWEELK